MIGDDSPLTKGASRRPQMGVLTRLDEKRNPPKARAGIGVRVVEGDHMHHWAILDEFAMYQQAKGLAARTIANRHYTLSALARATGKSPLGVTLQDLRARLSRGIGKGSMQTERDSYKAFFAFLREEDHRTDDPTERLQRIRAPRGKPRPYSTDQIDKMLGSGAYHRTRVMILLGRFQGFRAAEIAAVDGRDIDLDSDTIRVIGKGGKLAIMPLHPAVRGVVPSMPRDGWWFPARGTNQGHIHSRSVSDLMRRAKDRSGIREAKLTGHSLRHAYGTDLVRAGVDLRTVQELMRHESLATTQIYTLIDDDQMRAGIARLPVAIVPEQSGRRAA